MAPGPVTGLAAGESAGWPVAVGRRQSVQEEISGDAVHNRMVGCYQDEILRFSDRKDASA